MINGACEWAEAPDSLYKVAYDYDYMLDKVAHVVEPEFDNFDTITREVVLEKIAAAMSWDQQFSDWGNAISEHAKLQQDWTNMQKNIANISPEQKQIWETRLNNAHRKAQQAQAGLKENWGKQTTPSKYKNYSEATMGYMNKGIADANKATTNFFGKPISGDKWVKNFNAQTAQHNQYIQDNNIKPFKPPTKVNPNAKSAERITYNRVKTQVKGLKDAYKANGMDGVMDYASKNKTKLMGTGKRILGRYGTLLGTAAAMTGAGRAYMRYQQASNMLNRASNFVSNNRKTLMGVGGLAIGATALSNAMSRANDRRINQ